jgi:hypothetical protein
MKRGANKIGHHDYVACVKPSHKYVLTICDKVYQIENQGFAGSERNAGSTVKANGTQAPNLLPLWPWGGTLRGMPSCLDKRGFRPSMQILASIGNALHMALRHVFGRFYGR